MTFKIEVLVEKPTANHYSPGSRLTPVYVWEELRSSANSPYLFHSIERAEAMRDQCLNVGYKDVRMVPVKTGI